MTAKEFVDGFDGVRIGKPAIEGADGCFYGHDFAVSPADLNGLAKTLTNAKRRAAIAAAQAGHAWLVSNVSDGAVKVVFSDENDEAAETVGDDSVKFMEARCSSGIECRDTESDELLSVFIGKLHELYMVLR